MIFGDFGLVLNVLTIAILSFSFTLFVVSLLIVQLNRLLSQFNAKSRSRLLWCIVTLPWVVSFLSVVILVFPELFKWQSAWLTSPLHWHHIYTFSVLSWHGVSLLLFSTLVLLLLLMKSVKAIKIISNFNLLNEFSKPETMPNGCMIIDSKNVSAFTSGLLKPQAYITQGLHDQLSSEESCVVQQHELAHAKYSHPLKKYTFSIFSTFYPNQLGCRLNESYSLALEQTADNAVLALISDVTLISKTIIKVTRLQSFIKTSQQEPVAGCAFTTHPFELRIRYLLNDNKGNSFPYLLVLISAITIASISTFSVDFIHHSFEHLFSH